MTVEHLSVPAEGLKEEELVPHDLDKWMESKDNY